jgi:hypothetical protein
MTDDTIIQDIYRQAYADVLHEHATEILCNKCSKLFESEALNRYRLLMSRRREEMAQLQTRIEKEKQHDARRKKLEKGSHE